MLVLPWPTWSSSDGWASLKRPAPGMLGMEGGRHGSSSGSLSARPGSLEEGRPCFLPHGCARMA